MKSNFADAMSDVILNLRTTPKAESSAQFQALCDHIATRPFGAPGRPKSLRECVTCYLLMTPSVAGVGR